VFAQDPYLKSMVLPFARDYLHVKAMVGGRGADKTLHYPVHASAPEKTEMRVTLTETGPATSSTCPDAGRRVRARAHRASAASSSGAS
jgi:hypothetical protein